MHRRPWSLILALFPTVATAQAGPPVLRADSAYEWVQRERAIADSLITRGDPAGVARLRAVTTWLATPIGRDLAQGDPWFGAREGNVWYDLAMAALRAGDTAQAFTALEQVLRAGASGNYASFMAQDSLFAPLRGTAHYRDLFDRFRAQNRLWRDSAFVSPYREGLSDAEKVAGLSLFWSEARLNFPGALYRGPRVDIDSLYLATLPRVLGPMSTWDYYRVLREFAAAIHDSHTGAYAPAALRESLFVRPPLTTALIEGRVLVTKAPGTELTALGLRVGDELTRIDGVPVLEYAATRVLPTVAWATPQDRDARLYFYELLRGPKLVPVRLTVTDGRGAPREITVPRTGYASTPFHPVEGRRLAGNIGYVAIHTFNFDSLPWRFDSVMASLGTVRALIIDVRDNGGGNSTPGYDILRRLATHASGTSRMYTPLYRAAPRAWGVAPGWHRLEGDSITPHPTIHHTMPVAVLIGGMTFSAAEDFAAAFDQMDRGPLVGTPTGGNTGQPYFFRLPGGGSAQVRSKHDTYADGTEFLGIGIQPTIWVAPTLAGLRAGRDEVLDAAVQALRGR